MSTIKSSTDHLTLNADGASKDIKFQANGVEKAVIDSSGNVGLGVTPETWASGYTGLQIGGSGSIMSNGSSTYYSENYYYDGTDRYINTDEATTIVQTGGKHQFLVAPLGTADAAITWTTAMAITNSGQVLVGATATPNDFKMYIEGDATNPKVLYSKVPGSGDVSHFYFVNPTGVVGSIGTNGSATSYYTSSDYRLKENVVPMTGSIDRLKQLKPSKFNFIADADKTVDGFLAHEAQEVVPEAITGTKDAMMTEEYEVTPAVMDGDIVVTEAVMGEREVEDYQGIDQSKLVPLLVASLQEAVARIEVLEAQLNA